MTHKGTIWHESGPQIGSHNVPVPGPFSNLFLLKFCPKWGLLSSLHFFSLSLLPDRLLSGLATTMIPRTQTGSEAFLGRSFACTVVQMLFMSSLQGSFLSLGVPFGCVKNVKKAQVAGWQHRACSPSSRTVLHVCPGLNRVDRVRVPVRIG